MDFYGYKIYTNGGRSALVFRRMGQEPELLCELPSDAPEARAELNRRMAFEGLFHADVLDRGARGDLGHCTRESILAQVEKMLDEPEIRDLLGQGTVTREMTLSYSESTNRTVVTYRGEDGELQVPYRDTKPEDAEKRFRREYGLEHKDIKVTVCGH